MKELHDFSILLFRDEPDPREQGKIKEQLQ